jgi:signal transduction histidine kinase
MTRTLPGRPLDLALLELLLTGLVLAGVEIALLIDGPLRPIGLLLLFPLVGTIYLATGLLAWRRRPANRVGALLVFGALTYLGAGLANTGTSALIAAGQIVASLPIVIVLHLLLAFPSGHVRTTLGRSLTGFGYAVALLLQAPQYLFTESPPPYAPLAVRSDPHLAHLAYLAQTWSGAALVLAIVIVLGRRLLAAPGRSRRLLGPLYAYGIVAILFLPVSAHLFPQPGADTTLLTLQLAALAGVPLVFVPSILLGEFARTAEIEQLSLWISAERPGAGGLNAALAEALGDRSVQLALWSPGHTGYVDGAGRRVELPGISARRAAVEIESGGLRLAAIVYDATLIAEPELVRAAGQVVAIALERELLSTELTRSEAALDLARARVAEAVDRTRRRIGQDLHDGLQSRLVLLALQAGLLGHDDLRRGLDTAIDELRALAEGSMPSLVAERGLCSAVDDLVRRLPLPVRLEIDDELPPLTPAVESTAYFVISEAVTNAIKHAGARELWLRISSLGGSLRVEVGDDGIGGSAAPAGAGIRGMTERVELIGGRVRIDSTAGTGTRFVAELPCA